MPSHINRPTSAHKQLAALAISAFAIGFGSYVVIGALNEIAQAFQVSPSQAGWIISIYSICFAIAAPASALMMSRLNRRTILCLSLSLFTLGNLVCFLSDALMPLILGRVITACGAAMFTPNAAALATALMTPERKGFALSLVYGGMTVAQAIGIPVSTWIAHNSGWRYTFAFVVFFGVVGIFMLGTLPNHGAESKPTAKPDEAITKRIAWPIIGLLATSFLIIVSEFSVYSYISVILSDTRIDGRPILSIVLFAFGIGAILGNIATGVLTDRFGPTIVLLSAVSAQTMLFTAMIFLRDDGMAAILLGFGWGVMGYIYLIPIQYRLLSRARHGQSFVLAINGSLTHIGVAAGAVIGGLAMGSGGMPLLAGVSVGMAVLGLAVAAIFMPDRRDTLSSSIKDMKT